MEAVAIILRRFLATRCLDRFSPHLRFVEYDGSGTLDTATEPYTFTDSDGAFSLSSTQGTQKVIVTTDSATAGNLPVSAIDGSAGTALSGISLTGPSGASVLSPASTLLEKSSLTEAEVAKSAWS